MSEIEQLVEQVTQATDYQTNKRILGEKIQTDLHLPFNGGLFKITPELLAFVTTWPADLPLFLVDVYENPVKVNQQDFLIKAKQHYVAVMNTWHQQHEELKRIRKI